VLLVVTGAGFSADSGLATYVDVADIDAYRGRGWEYRDLCKPPAFTDFSGLNINNDGGEEENSAGVKEEGGENAAAAVAKVVDGQQKGEIDYDKNMELEEMESKNDSDSENERILELPEDNEECPTTLPDEDDIEHPQYFYGFWGQCCNDYRRVKPHEGYDILARWGREKNIVPMVNGKASAATTNNENYKENASSVVAQEIRKITHTLEHGTKEDDSDDSSSSSSFHYADNDEEEPYHVSPTERAGAFFVFTSNVDAHSFDVFESHEIRECHGNVELWSCHNFACGTNATVKGGGSLGGIDGGDGSDDDDEKQEPPARQRRLWRLPTDHQFLVDSNSMGAPYSKIPLKNQTMERVAAATTATTVASSGSPPALKRRKSSMQDGHNESTASSVSEHADSDTRAGVGAENQNDDAPDDTATALGGIMETTLWNHLLKKKLSESNSCNVDSNGDSEQPAHIGDVHGKPRLNPLRYMYPPATANSTTGNSNTTSAAENYYLPISKNENWPKCPRCHEAARPAVLMFDDLDWVYNLAQERRWQRWCQSMLKLCKRRSGGGRSSAGHDAIGSDSDSASTVSGTNMSENGWEDVEPAPSTEEKTDEAAAKDTAATTPPPPAVSDQPNKTTATSPASSTNQSPPLKVAILEIGCGYNVPTCRVIAESLVAELSRCGGDATLVRINPSHPEPDDHAAEDFIISIMEKGLVALKIIDEHYCELVKGGSLEED